jgi:pimeloyl-ACP methyl ester carboxylesterase
MPCRPLLLCLVALSLQAGLPSFKKVGQGPGILLIHGFGGNKEVWSGVVPDLARDHTVLSVDLPGSGGSPGPVVVDGVADLGAVARDLAALVRREGLAPCLVVGHSMGGPIAARAVLEDPAAFRGLLLVDSFLGALPAAYLEPIAVALPENPSGTLSIFFAMMTAGPAQAQRVLNEALKVPTPTLQAYLRAMTRDILEHRQTKLRLPVLQVTSGPRNPDPGQEAATLAQYGFQELPAFRMIHVPAAKHWVMWDAPEAFLIALRAFEAGFSAPG